MLNKKGTTSFASMMVWIMVVMAIAYIMDFGGFKDIVDTTFGNTTAISSAPTVSVNAEDGISQHIATDSASHDYNPTRSQQPEYANTNHLPVHENTNIEPSFMENYGLTFIILITIGLIVGYSIYKYKKKQGGVKNEKKLFKKSFSA